ncbi:MAG: bglX 4 [Chitinophagaceae bacterium]|nr:bglX 4 [Chitinophagaceae bacterium]
MNKLGSHLAILFVLLFLSISSLKAQTSKEEIEKKIDALLASMTIEEKAGQMTQLTLDYVCQGKFFDDKKEMKIDPAKLDTALLKYHVGSILNTGSYALTRDNWYELIQKIQTVATQKTRLKIPVLYGIDAIHGANYTVGATLFPQELAQAATWNPSLIEQAGAVTAYEVRASAIPWNFSPVLDLGRQPLWARFFETFGEDPYLVSAMGEATIKGYQGKDISNPEKVAACLKHYMGYSASYSGKDRTPILLPERILREYYLLPFAKAVENGAMTVMVNSGEINGKPVHIDYHIITEILKQELKFDGFAVTDWEDIIFLTKRHRVAATYKEAIALAINAGIDMSMVPLEVDFTKLLIELVKEGKIPTSRMDDAVRRILRVKYRLGLFKQPYYEKASYKKFGSEEFKQINFQAAAEALTLLKNKDGLLPLAKSKKVLLTGAAANSLTPLNGAWTHTWQGLEPKYNPKDKQTVYQALQTKIGADHVVYVEGTTYDKDVNTAEAVKQAANVDYIIVCLAEKPGTEKDGDIHDLNLDRAQQDFVKALSKTGKPIFFVMAFDRPRLITEIEPLASGILMAYLPGNEGGRAIVDVLYGDVNPSGKLPFSYPKYPNALNTYDYKSTEDVSPGQYLGVDFLYPFGSGLSYTSFSYTDLQLSTEQLKGNDTLTVSIKITNSGSKEGKEVVQLYTRDEFASITPSVKRLKGFQKINLKAGESRVVQFKLHRKDLSFVDSNNQWITEPGDFTVLIDKLSKQFLLVD